MPILPRPAWRLLAVAALLAAGWAVLRHALPAEAPPRTTTITDLSAPPVRDLLDLNAPPGGAPVELTGPYPSFVVPASGKGLAVRSLVLRIRPLRPLDPHRFMLVVTAASGPGAGYEMYYMGHYRGLVRQDGRLTAVTWHLPVAAERCRVELEVPRFTLLGFVLGVDEGPLFRLDSVEVTEGKVPPAPASAGALHSPARTLAAALLLAVLLLGLGWVWPAARLTPGRARGLLVAALALTGVAVLCLLPPFQGPDEEAHWKSGLSWVRPGVQTEPALFNLCEALDAKHIAFHPERPFPPPALQAPPTTEGMLHDEWDRVNYAHPLTYPAVGAVSLLFPRVETTPEALLFYHLCRALPLAALAGLLWLTNRAGLLGYTALAFLASPLLLQQSVIITSDTLPNLGAVAACLLWAARMRRPDGRLTAALVAVCLLATAAKPPVYAGLLLLPMFFLPWRKVPHLKLLLALAATATLPVLWAMGRYGFAPAATLTSPTQLADFLSRCRLLLEESAGPIEWFRPLGWLDTGLSERHETLIHASLAAGLALDLLTLGPGLVRGLRRNPGRTAALAAALAANAGAVFLGFCLVMYSTYNHQDTDRIHGIQQRYFFPPLILILLLPPALAVAPTDGGRWAGTAARVAAAVGLALMGVLLLARHVELIADLLTRYW